MEKILSNFQLSDLIVLVGFFIIIFAISAYYSRKAGKDTTQFFLSGRNLPWYLAGTAMVATTFAADTPLAVTELVANNGVAGNWLWWNLAIGGLLTVFFFSKLWRRAGIMTDLEFIEMRYSGKEAAFLRGFRAIYLGLIMNAIVLGWVHKAMEKIFLVTVPGIDPFILVVILAVIIAVYASASGLLGTIRTDSFQFLFALTGCIILAVIVVQLPEVGGLKNLKSLLPEQTLDFFPRINTGSEAVSVTGNTFTISIGAFLAFVGIQWWSSWYPGSDPGGGGYIAQRMMSAKNEKHSFLATLWFNIAHYTLRPWPWILVALAALVILPRANSTEELKAQNPEYFAKAEKIYEQRESWSYEEEKEKNAEFAEYYEKYENTADPGVMYPKLMVRYLPAGLLGLLIAVFLAAYMSTIASQLNWGTSYLVNDFYKRFVKPKASEKHYIIVSRVGIIIMVAFSLVISKYFLTTISGAWMFILNVSAGMGAVLILRWYWWRINAWSEIAAMIAPVFIYPIAKYGIGLESPITLFPIAFGSSVVWIAVTYLTSPVRKEILVNFYRKIHPGGIGWQRFHKEFPEVKHDTGYKNLFISWGLGIISIYSAMYGTGKIIFGEYLLGTAGITASVLAGVLIFKYSKTNNN